MHVRLRHFYCTLEEMADPSLRGLAFVVGTGTGRPNEPGRVIDASPAAQRLGVSPGMPLRRAYRLAPRARFLPASHDRYRPYLQRVKECYRVYSRIIETIPFADAYIDLRGCELAFDSPVTLGERLCGELSALGLIPLIGIANGKALAELASSDKSQGWTPGSTLCSTRSRSVICPDIATLHSSPGTCRRSWHARVPAGIGRA